MKFLGMSIVLMLSPLKFSITTPLNFQNMQTELTVVQAFWNLELIPIRKISSQASVFAVSVICPCVSGADLYSGGGYVSAIAKYSGTFSYPSLGISNPNREKPTCYQLRDTLKHMNDSWKRLIETKRF